MTSDDAAKVDGRLRAALLKSGFPLQTRVEHEITANARDGWRLLASEYPWRDADGHDQFVDAIAVCGTVVLVIECKKAQDRLLLFLRPLSSSSDTTGPVDDFMVWHIERSTPGKTSTVYLINHQLSPRSLRSQFCVATDQSSQRLLEQDARSVVLASGAVADHFPRGKLPNRAFVVPVIVVTSPLYTVRYKPPDIALDTGMFTDVHRHEITPIPWIRFHKTLSAEPPAEAQTVFVVSAASLPEFLAEVAQGQGLYATR